MNMIRAVSPDILGSHSANHSELPHILLVLDQIPKVLGGGERVALRLASLLPKYGFRASILTFSIDSESLAFKAQPCPIYLLPLPRTYDLRALHAAFELRSFLKQQKVQVVQTFFESSDLWAGLVTKTLSDAKLIWSRRDMGILRSSSHRVAYRMLAGTPDMVFAVSEQVRKHCIEVDKVPPARVQTVYNGLDLDEWNADTQPDKTPGEFVISTVGNIRPVKGHDIFIKAAASIVQRFPGASFSIAGEVANDAYIAELQAMVRDLNLTDRFHFAGGITNLREYLSKTDIFVLPSRSEGFSNAIVEAMALSLPVVATSVGGNAEAVQDGVTGFIVPPEDPDALAAAVCRLLSDPLRAKAMGRAGKESVAERFTTDAMMIRTTNAYSKLLADKRS